MARSVRRYEFKVEYGCSTNEEKWTKFYVEEEEMSCFSIDALHARLRQKCQFLCGKLRYQDRAQDWIDLNHDDIDSFIDMIETATKVPERENIFRIILKVSSIISPSHTKDLNTSTGEKRIHSPSPVKTKKRARNRLKYGEHSKESAANVYVTPTQKLFDKFHGDENEMRHEVAKKEQELIELEQSYRDAAVAKSTQRQSAQCTKCHNSGHNRTRCTFATCISATICGDIKRHPDENKYLKDKRDELKTSRAKLTKIELDIKCKKEAYKAVQNTFAAQVQTDLINSDPKRYLHCTEDGRSVPNWLLVNSDIRKLERVCHGKVPSKTEIKRLLKNYDDNFDILANSQDNQSHANPVKDLWARKGVQFPGKGPLPNFAKESVDDILERNGLAAIPESSDQSDSEEEYEGLNLLFRAASFLDDRM
jgi:hypothetical protein